MFGGVFDPDEINKKIAEKEALTNEPGFWDDNDKATKVLNDIKMLKGRIEPWIELKKQIEDIETLYELGIEENDQSLEAELKESYEKAKTEYDHQSILNLLSDEVDRNDCFLSVHAGAGGTEACDWAFMLSRMYQRWAERHGYKIEVVSQEEAEGGLKSINMKISGPYVYGYTKITPPIINSVQAAENIQKENFSFSLILWLNHAKIIIYRARIEKRP